MKANLEIVKFDAKDVATTIILSDGECCDFECVTDFNEMNGNY